MGYRECYQKYENVIGGVFQKYGTVVVKYPWIVLACCVLINGLLGIGLVRLTSVSDAETLYTPENNQASKDRSTLQSLFDDFSGSNYYYRSTFDFGLYATIIFKTKDGSTILTSSYLDEIESVDNTIRTVSIEYAGSSYTHSDVCAIRNGSCVVDGDFVYSTSFRAAVTAGTVSYPLFEANRIEGTFGNIAVANNILSSATYVKLTYRLKQETDQAYDLARLWEDAFLTKIQSLTTNLTDLAFEHSFSLNDELDKSTAGDIVFFALTITLMLTYASFAAMGGNCVSMRPILGQAGVLATCLAILGSFGFVSAVGVEFVNIVGVMPFLVIGIGLDDMFILMSGLADEPFDASIEDRIKGMLKHSGVAITITSLTDFLAFGIGATSTFKSVRNFCLYTGIAVLFCYINQLTFFVPCMVIHERRVQAQRHTVTCLPTKSREDLEKDGKAKFKVYCCGGSPPTKREDIESPVEKYPKMVIQKIVLFKPFKVVILILFAVYLGISIWGTTNLQQGLLLNNLVTDDSYMYRYTKWFDENFSERVLCSFTISSELTYSSSSTQTLITNLMTNVKADSYVTSTFEINWLTEYANDASYDASSETAFVTNLKTFLASRSDLSNDVLFNNAETAIVASRFHVLSIDLPTSTVQGKFMERMREITEASGLPVFPYNPQFIFFEQFVSILSSTLQTLGIAIAVIFVVTAIFMPHPVLVIFVTVTMVMIIVGIFGFMHFWGLTLSSITMIHIIMSVGFSVDFSAHICHAYITVDGTDRDSRVNAALTRSGGPIVNAAFSSIAGILMLLLSSSFIFQSFFKMMFIVIVFGLLHAIFFLPVVLSLIGPHSSKSDDTKEANITSSKASLAAVSPSVKHDKQMSNGSVSAFENESDTLNQKY